MKINISLYIIGIIAITIVLVIGVGLIFDYSSHSDLKYDEDNGTVVSNSSKIFNRGEIVPEYTTQTIKHNIQPQFKIGERFEYEEESTSIISPSTHVEKISFYVENTDRINGTDCYLVISHQEETLFVDPLVRNKNHKLDEIQKSFQDEKYWIYKDKGIILKVSVQQGVIKNGTKIYNGPPRKAESPNNNVSELVGNKMYAPWMLALNDSFKMEMNATSIKSDYWLRMTFEVIGREKVNNRDCFKIEIRELDKNNHVSSQQYLWVDIKKRILVKGERYYENLKVGGINLVSTL